MGTRHQKDVFLTSRAHWVIFTISEGIHLVDTKLHRHSVTPFPEKCGAFSFFSEIRRMAGAERRILVLLGLCSEHFGIGVVEMMAAGLGVVRLSPQSLWCSHAQWF